MIDYVDHVVMGTVKNGWICGTIDQVTTAQPSFGPREREHALSRLRIILIDFDYFHRRWHKSLGLHRVICIAIISRGLSGSTSKIKRLICYTSLDSWSRVLPPSVHSVLCICVASPAIRIFAKYVISPVLAEKKNLFGFRSHQRNVTPNKCLWNLKKIHLIGTS